MKTTCLSMSVLIASVLFLSCNQKQPSPPSELELAKTELAALLKNEGAAFAPKTDIYEDENATVTILKARNETDTLQVSAGRLREGLLLGAIRVKDKKTSQADTYTSTLVVRDSATFLRLVNSATRKEHVIDLTPANDIVIPPPPPLPPSCDLDCCLDNFEAYLCVFQNLANKFCRTYYPAVICCDANRDFCISVHYIIRPTRLKCLIATDIAILENAGIRTLPRIVVPQPKPQ
ncbi:MAG: hypothetical protein IPH12_17995 [Saprospirales bacterium]|nr:hypothetical protein [Saprospirales bacterium]